MDWGNHETLSVPCGSLARWAARFGVFEAYGFEQGTSSHGRVRGTYVQLWRAAESDSAWRAWAMSTSYFDRDKQYAERIVRGATVSKRRAARVLEVLEETAFWSDARWPEERRIGVDGVTWVFGGVCEGRRRVRAAWSPTDGAPITLARAMLDARPGVFERLTASTLVPVRTV